MLRILFTLIFMSYTQAMVFNFEVSTPELGLEKSNGTLTQNSKILDSVHLDLRVGQLMGIPYHDSIVTWYFSPDFQFYDSASNSGFKLEDLEEYPDLYEKILNMKPLYLELEASIDFSKDIITGSELSQTQLVLRYTEQDLALQGEQNQRKFILSDFKNIFKYANGADLLSSIERHEGYLKDFVDDRFTNTDLGHSKNSYLSLKYANEAQFNSLKVNRIVWNDRIIADVFGEFIKRKYQRAIREIDHSFSDQVLAQNTRLYNVEAQRAYKIATQLSKVLGLSIQDVIDKLFVDYDMGLFARMSDLSSIESHVVEGSIEMSSNIKSKYLVNSKITSSFVLDYNITKKTRVKKKFIFAHGLTELRILSHFNVDGEDIYLESYQFVSRSGAKAPIRATLLWDTNEDYDLALSLRPYCDDLKISYENKKDNLKSGGNAYLDLDDQGDENLIENIVVNPRSTNQDFYFCVKKHKGNLESKARLVIFVDEKISFINDTFIWEQSFGPATKKWHLINNASVGI